ncbi:LysR family transcriptional regulator [Novosphingobium sp. Fuku2-ISO-50]|uniref:LysR family transcriptional regulator n=1 Tax=Novosphingobium sp. Fuku2-ISO-50 TaxID=1739114 RepID=UPI00076DB3D6|nr:LysR family transcriptional regulator [Novosphingobium sp. Fuku2-ISO-50]KUR78829.1 LysR family transcriptional regulator [Novosphingobium sp. Fuku2-ISO-50]
MKRLAIYHFETLLWIARLGTFRAAAERLNTTQPAISARVREIEDQLGVDLFRREGRLMVLTARGRDLVREIEPLWVGFERVLTRASDFAGVAGVVRVGAGEIAAAGCLPGFVRDVERDLPGVVLEVELDLTARMVQQLMAGRNDLAFLAGPVAIPGIRTAAIGTVALVFAASATTARSLGAEPIPIWALPPSSPLHAVTHECLAIAKLAARAVATCDNVRTLIDIVLAGRGAAVMPETMVRAELAAGTLVEIAPRPQRQLQFEAAIREIERDPLVLELFRRASLLQVDP